MKESRFNYNFATLCGFIALLCWSATALMAVKLTDIPPFQFLTVIQILSFIGALVHIGLKKKWRALKQPLLLWIVGSICVPLNILAYFLAFKYISAPQADLIYYMYPVLVLILGVIFTNNTITWKGILGAVIGFLGVFILFNDGSTQGLAESQWEGIIFAFLSGFSWALYILFSRHYRLAPYELIGCFYGLGALVSFLIHINFETHVSPTVGQVFIMILWGIGFQNFALFLWEYGIKNGNFVLINVFSYINPVISIFLLIISGYATFTQNLLLATICVTIGVLISYKDTTSLQKDINS